MKMGQHYISFQTVSGFEGCSLFAFNRDAGMVALYLQSLNTTNLHVIKYIGSHQ